MAERCHADVVVVGVLFLIGGRVGVRSPAPHQPRDMDPPAGPPEPRRKKLA